MDKREHSWWWRICIFSCSWNAQLTRHEQNSYPADYGTVKHHNNRLLDKKAWLLDKKAIRYFKGFMILSSFELTRREIRIRTCTSLSESLCSGSRRFRCGRPVAQWVRPRTCQAPQSAVSRSAQRGNQPSATTKSRWSPSQEPSRKAIWGWA